MDITWVIEILMIVCFYFGYKYGRPIIKDILMCRWAKIIVASANEQFIVGEIKDKWSYALSAMKLKLEKYKITFDEEEVIACLKSAVTALRVEISGTDAEMKIDN